MYTKRFWRTKLLSPFAMPVLFFGLTILAGSFLLEMEPSLTGRPISWLDALFTSTSATCVTGLIVKDTGSFFSQFGQVVILLLMQVGGLGIMTYTTLVLYLIKRRITLTDHLVVGQTLLNDPSFSLGRFLLRVVVGTLVIEAAGALALWHLDGVGFAPFSAVFHAVSAFCNAGFSLFPNSLSNWRADTGVNLVFILLITLGGLGFHVLTELARKAKHTLLRLMGSEHARPTRLSWTTRLVLSTSVFLSLGGGVAIYLAEIVGGETWGNGYVEFIASLFQSVTCRTAGFNTIEISHMTNVSLVFMLFLMFVGGSPGSCAGGIKTTTLRALWGFVISQMKGHHQIKLGRCALKPSSMQKAFTLVVFALLFITLSTIVLNMTEGGDVPHIYARGRFLESLFEVISAFGTVGLSMGLTAKLTSVGKVVIILLMFVGRIGPICVLTALQSWQSETHYRLPEDDLPLG